MLQKKSNFAPNCRRKAKRGGLLEKMAKDLAKFENENNQMMSPQGLQGNQIGATNSAQNILRQHQMVRDEIHFEKIERNLLDSVLVSGDFAMPKIRKNLEYAELKPENSEKIMKTIEEAQESQAARKSADASRRQRSVSSSSDSEIENKNIA